jgi:hypothetical protein
VKRAAGLGLMAVSLAACNVDANNDGETQLDEDAGGPNNLNSAVGTATTPVLLTSNRDFGNFSGEAYAGEVWSPGGDTRVDSLGNEDSITGTGAADVLTATLSDSDVAPILLGIETLNVAFIGGGGGYYGSSQTLDLEDSYGFNAINITRITNDYGVTIDNVNDVLASLSVKNSGEASDAVTVLFNREVLDGASDTLALSLDDVQTVNFAIAGEDGEGYETINMTVKDVVDLDDLEIASTVTLNVAGAGELTISDLSSSAGSLETLDASAATGDIDINLGASDIIEARVSGSSGTDIDFTYTGSDGADYIRLDELSVSAAPTGGDDDDGHDSIDGGTGANTIDFSVASTANLVNDEVTIANIQTVRIDGSTAGAAITVDLDASLIGGLETLILRNDDDVSTAAVNFEINNMAAGTLVQVQHASLDANSITAANTDVYLHQEDASGDDDSQTVQIIAGTNTAEEFNFTLDVQGNDDDLADPNDAEVENLTIIDSDTEDNTVVLLSVAEHTSSVTLSGGRAGDTFEVDGTIVAETVNASAQLSDVTITNGTADQTITMGSGDDIIVFEENTLDENDDVSGGAGTEDRIATVYSEFPADDLVITGVEIFSVAATASGTIDVSNSDDITTVELLSDDTSGEAVLGTHVITMEADEISTIRLIGDEVADTTSDVFNGLTMPDSPAAVTIESNNMADDATVGAITLSDDVTSLSIESDVDSNLRSTTFASITAAGLASLVVDDSTDDTDGTNGTVISVLSGTEDLESIDATEARDGLTIGKLEALGDDAVIDLRNPDDVGGDADDSITITFTGDTGADNLVIHGGAGGETIVITNGDLDDLVINGGDGDDTINLTGATGSNIEINGGDGDDVITGSDDGDEINGGDGVDLITGGAGKDMLTGGAGVDTFVFATGDSGITVATADTITDFTTAVDEIDVLDTAVALGVTIANGANNTNLADFIVDADVALTGGKGVYAEFNINGAGDGYVVVDEDASGNVNAGDTLIILTGVNAITDLVAGDFL